MKFQTTIVALTTIAIAGDLLAQDPGLSIKTQPTLQWELQTDTASTFFLQESDELQSWDFTGDIVIGDGSSVLGEIDSPGTRGFIRYSSGPTNYPAVLDTDGDGQTDGYEIANGTNPLDELSPNEIYLEAEHPTTSQNYFAAIETLEAGYSGNGHLQSFGNTTPATHDGTSSDSATYTFSVSQTGDYNIYFRVDHDKSGNNDSWFYRLDTGNWHTENGHSADGIDSFHWIGGASNPVSLTSVTAHWMRQGLRNSMPRISSS